MILYRDITYEEYNRLYCDIKFIEQKKYDGRCNTFNYVEGKEYIHFFRYFEHAKRYINTFGQMIIKCDIPDDKIVEEGYGWYTYKKMLCAAIPEYIINLEDYKIDCVKKINPSLRESIKTIGGISEVKIYDKLLKELYEKWYSEISLLDYGEYQFYTYLVNYFNGVGFDNALNIYAQKANKKLIKRR